MQQRTERTSHLSRRSTGWFAAVAVALMALTLILNACGADPAAVAAQRDKARLDGELQRARTSLGIPDTLLSPIITQERSIATSAGGWNYNAANADANYKLLYGQLIGIEQTAAETLKAQTSRDIDALTKALTARRAQGFSEANAYQARLDFALSDFAKARTPGDFVAVDTTVRQQTGALNSLWPAYEKLQEFRAALDATRTAGITSGLAQLEYNQDLAVLASAAPAARYNALQTVIDGQIMQLMADETEALPYIGATMLDVFQANINRLRQYGENTRVFQEQHDKDKADLAAARSSAGLLGIGRRIDQQMNAMALPLWRGQARYDLNELRRLINTVQAANRDNAYEYANNAEGIGSVQQEVDSARTIKDYQAADADVQSLMVDLRALNDDLHDSTPSSQPHATDLTLMNYYHVMSGKVVVVSLHEQAMRFYDNGKLVNWTYVTTGQPDLPTPPGLHYAMQKIYHTEFTSPYPPGSPYWYAPTPINYGILFANYGFFIHDAWWRYKFGPGSNLPHWDPLAFDGGSHGCVNVPEDNMAWIYNWTPLGAPIIVY